MGGLLQAIISAASQQPPNRLRQAMNGGDSPLSGDFGAPGSWSDPSNYRGGGMVDRITDDTTRHPQGFEDSSSQNATALRGSLADQVRQQSLPQQPSHLDQMQSQYDQLGQQVNAPPKKMGMLKSLMLGALAGPKAGQAFQARNQNQQFQQNQLRERQNSILQQIEAERRMQEQNQREDERDVTSYERTLAQQREQDLRQPPHTIETDKGPMQWDMNSRQWSPIMANGQPVGPKAQPKPDTPEQQFFDSPGEAGKTLAQKLQDYARASQRPEQPQRPPQQLGIGPDGTVIDLKPGVKVPQGTRTVAGDLGVNKPTADEQKRADLAENLNENLATLEEIVTRRPDLFGPVAGRLTGLKGAIGSNDPDIGTLETIKHQIGMAQISAHGMRSAQGVDAAATSILNSFKNGPDAVKASVNAARNSVKTFTQDANRGQRQQPQGGQPSLKQKVSDPLGIL